MQLFSQFCSLVPPNDDLNGHFVSRLSIKNLIDFPSLTLSQFWLASQEVYQVKNNFLVQFLGPSGN